MPRSPGMTSRRALGATVGAFILLAGIAMTPLAAPPSLTETRAQYVETYSQGFTMSTASQDAGVDAAATVRDEFGATPGPQVFIAGGTNHDWAKLVLLYGGWPITDNNVTVITRWMRQENYTDSWWNRNNPLNLGAGGYASHGDLVSSAQSVARTLTNGAGYQEIVAGFAASADTSVTEYAIWASPWAGGHYAWGGHWYTNPVPVVRAPASAWGR